MMFNRLLFKISNLSLVVIQLTYRNTDSVGDQVMQAKTADNVKHADCGAHSVLIALIIIFEVTTEWKSESVS